ncbi:MOSC N-terminal beta barrel domain-containing protein [Edwardsiella ictaluri]|nr:MOSC N-terminal beta barrel domain-containing protein [Edwardsiella ictaluri]
MVQERQFMLIKATDSRMVTARTHPQLLGIRVSQDADSVTFHSAMQTPLTTGEIACPDPVDIVAT